MKFYKITSVGVLLLAIFGLLTGSVNAQKVKKSKNQTQSSKKVKKAKKTPKEIEVSTESDGEEQKSAGKNRLEKSGAGKQINAKTVQQETDFGKPTESKLNRAGSFDGDLRSLPKKKPADLFRPEPEGPNDPAIFIKPTDLLKTGGSTEPKVAPIAPVPSPLFQFDGMGRPPGNGFPPDTNGDVGPNHYIQTINTSLAIYSKTTGAALAGPLSFNTFMSQGNFGNLCDTNNFGDPVVLYDTFEDRWVITDFAFINTASGVTNPPGAFQCFAVSKTGDPVTGGWNYYSIQIADTLNDYPKFGIWSDGIYMMANEFGFGSLSGQFVQSRVWAFNKSQMYDGAANPQIVSFNAPRLDVNGGSVFTIIPSNARLQTGTPPPGTPNYFVSTGTYTNSLQVWKFSVDWNNVYNSTFTGPSVPGAGATWTGPPATVPSQGGNALDTLATRAMMQNQYTNIGGNESIWLTHTVRNSTTTGIAVPRYYELSVTGGTVAAATNQSAFHQPDNTVNRFMPSLAVDRMGDMMLGYTASSSTMKPAIRYAGRLAGDPLSTLPQTETDLIQGGGTQVGNCGTTACTRWGDYSAMSLDPVDGCTFWFTTEYYAADGLNYNTRIGSFAFPSCVAVANGTVQGTVTFNGNPVPGATVSLGSRTATTNGSGFYSFINLPAGTYPGIKSSSNGFNTSASSMLVVAGGGTTVKDFALTLAPGSGTFVDTTQADFSLGQPAKIDLTTSPNDMLLARQNLDQQNAGLGGSGIGINLTAWGGQTFTPTVTGLLTRAELALFCSGCTGTTPNLTVSVRATSANVPTGADLGTGTITGFSSGTSQFYTVVFSTPASLTAGTRYAIIVRPTVAPSAGTYALTRSGSATVGESVYPNGDRVASADTGATWTTPTIPAAGGVVTDLGFRTYMTTLAGTFVSSLKDFNPAPGVNPQWTSLNWNASIPATTTLQFQVAGSNNASGPFNFVGPDTTAATFYTTSGGSLLQFNGKRYLKYKAFLSTTDPSFTDSFSPAVSATVNDVTISFLAPTAANVTISGRVLTTDGEGIRNAKVTLTNSNGATRTATTNSFGYYNLTDISTGETYVVGVISKGYNFASRTLSIQDDAANVDFTPEP